MAKTYEDIMKTNDVDISQEIYRILLVIMYRLVTKIVSGYHYVRGKYLKYKYGSSEIKPTDRYFLTSEKRESFFKNSFNIVPSDRVYIEEWNDVHGHKKMIVRYEGETIPTEWKETPFDKPPAKCPWVWVGDRDTEVDLTRTFDKFLVPGNIITMNLVSRLIKITENTNLIYIETKTFNQVKFPGDGITIEADVE